MTGTQDRKGDAYDVVSRCDAKPMTLRWGRDVELAAGLLERDVRDAILLRDLAHRLRPYPLVQLVALVDASNHRHAYVVSMDEAFLLSGAV